jgi:hypothetical protein
MTQTKHASASNTILATAQQIDSGVNKNYKLITFGLTCSTLVHIFKVHFRSGSVHEGP